jgi:hypothetical protein
MLEAMERTSGVQTRAAEMLGMTFRSFRYFAKKYGISALRGAARRAEANDGIDEAVPEAEELQPVD